MGSNEKKANIKNFSCATCRHFNGSTCVKTGEQVDIYCVCSKHELVKLCKDCNNFNNNKCKITGDFTVGSNKACAMFTEPPELTDEELLKLFEENNMCKPKQKKTKKKKIPVGNIDIFFNDEDTKHKTTIFECIDARANKKVGEIRYYFPWHKYCFFPSEGAILTDQAIEQINSVLSSIIYNGQKATIIW